VDFSNCEDQQKQNALDRHEFTSVTPQHRGHYGNRSSHKLIIIIN
jgi:hypothetical protein